MSMTRRRLLDDTFKKSVVGNPAIATDSLARMYPGITMQGWTEQDGTPTPENPVPIVNSGNYDEASGKYKFDVALGGANLFDISKVNLLNGIVNNGDGTITVNTPSGSSAVSTNKTLRELCNGISTGTYFLQADTTGQDKYIYIGRVWNFGTSTELTDEDLEKYVLLYASGINTTATISNIMINYEETPLPYEPYKPPQTVTLTSDRPLTKWDRLEKRNGQWGLVYGSAEVDMSSEMTWNIHQGYEQETSNLFRGVMSGVDKIDSTDMLLCNILPYYQAAYADVNGIYSLSNNFFARIIGIKSLEDFQEKIQGGKVLAKLSTETFVPLTTAEQEAMNALHTYRPTTVLTNQQDCEMALTYKTRKTMEVTT